MSLGGLRLEVPVALLLLCLGAAATLRLARAGGPYRAGPWPGLTPRGAALLLACAAMLGGLDVWLGPPRQPLPDVVLFAALSVAPLALASVVVRTPGAATAACGAYLLPRSVLSLVDASIEPPPLLLVPSLAFELAAWLRPADLAWLRRRSRWQRRPPRVQRQLSARRTALGGASFGLVLGLVQRPFALLLGASPSAWPLDQTALAAVLASLACGGLCAAVYACMPRSIR